MNTCKKHLETILLKMSMKFKESTQWYKFVYVATAIATAAHSQKMATNREKKIQDWLVGK